MRACDESDSSESSDSSSSSGTSSDLIERVRRSEPGAWERLVKIYTRLVYCWCRKEADLSDDDSADVAQNVFIAVFNGLDNFRREESNHTFRGWLRVITARKIVDHLRSKKRFPRALGGSDGDRLMGNIPAEPIDLGDLSEEDDLTERAIIVRCVLEEIRPQFSKKNWCAFWQAEIEGRPRNEIAEELQTTVAAVNQAIYRIRKRLREVLDELPE